MKPVILLLSILLGGGLAQTAVEEPTASVTVAPTPASTSRTVKPATTTTKARNNSTENPDNNDSQDQGRDGDVQDHDERDDDRTDVSGTASLSPSPTASREGIAGTVTVTVGERTTTRTVTTTRRNLAAQTSVPGAAPRVGIGAVLPAVGAVAVVLAV